MTQIAFAWPGLPDYAARCIRAMIDQGHSVRVVATRPNVPIEGMERSLGQSVYWIEEADRRATWSSLGAVVPDVLFCGGYSKPVFNSLAREVRDGGGHVVLMSDANWQGSLRQRIVDPVRHRFFFRNRFDGIFVPGASGERIARSWGYEPARTAQKLYGADPALFHGGPPVIERPRTFLFVGQFIARKNVRGLAEAFIRFADTNLDWTLCMCGSGPQVEQIPRHPRITVRGFVQPPQLAELLRQVRCLVLPSLEEHWGLVVHEAALSGCSLALSQNVGAVDDLARQDNAAVFQPGDTYAIQGALQEMAGWDKDRWHTAEATSRRLASGFGPEPFADSVVSLVHRVLGRSQ